METETIEHEGETYEVKYKPYLRCEHCGNEWATQSDAQRPSCSSCQRKTDREVIGKFYEDITRYSLLSFDAESGEEVVAALRQRADKYEAMLANGWRLNNTGGQSSVWLIKGDIGPIEIVE